jgi:plasmid stabilization system protein ParE
MGYRVELSKRAETDLEQLYAWVTSRAPGQGAAWFNGLERAILGLEQLPRRHRVATGMSGAEPPVRVLNYGHRQHVYRVFFAIDEQTAVVRVLHIRRGARRGPLRRDLDESS